MWFSPGHLGFAVWFGALGCNNAATGTAVGPAGAHFVPSGEEQAEPPPRPESSKQGATIIPGGWVPGIPSVEEQAASPPRPESSKQGATIIPDGWVPGNDKLSAALAGVNCDSHSEGWRRHRRHRDAAAFKAGGPFAIALDHVFGCMVFEGGEPLVPAVKRGVAKFSSIGQSGMHAQIPGGYVMMMNDRNIMIVLDVQEGSTTPIKDFAASLSQLAEAQWIIQRSDSVVIDAEFTLLADTESTSVTVFVNGSLRDELVERGFNPLPDYPNIWVKKWGVGRVSISYETAGRIDYPAPPILELVRVEVYPG